jgi:hypothetical protein
MKWQLFFELFLSSLLIITCLENCWNKKLPLYIRKNGENYSITSIVIVPSDPNYIYFGGCLHSNPIPKYPFVGKYSLITESTVYFKKLIS